MLARILSAMPAKALASSPYLTNLRTLDLSGNGSPVRYGRLWRSPRTLIACEHCVPAAISSAWRACAPSPNPRTYRTFLTWI